MVYSETTSQEHPQLHQYSNTDIGSTILNVKTKYHLSDACLVFIQRAEIQRRTKNCQTPRFWSIALSVFDSVISMMLCTGLKAKLLFILEF